MPIPDANANIKARLGEDGEAQTTSHKLQATRYKLTSLQVASRGLASHKLQAARCVRHRLVSEKTARLGRLIADVNYFSNAVWSHRTASTLLVPACSTCLAGFLIMLGPWMVGAGGLSTGALLVGRRRPSHVTWY